MLSKNLYSNKRLFISTNTLVRFVFIRFIGVENFGVGFIFFKIMKVIDFQYSDKLNVLILGSGWGVISFLKYIDIKKYNVFIIFFRSYFLFTFLLFFVLVGIVDEKLIIEFIVNFVFKKKGNVIYYEVEVIFINFDRNIVIIKLLFVVSQLY